MLDSSVERRKLAFIIIIVLNVHWERDPCVKCKQTVQCEQMGKKNNNNNKQTNIYSARLWNGRVEESEKNRNEMKMKEKKKKMKKKNVTKDEHVQLNA